MKWIKANKDIDIYLFDKGSGLVRISNAHAVNKTETEIEIGETK